MILITIVLSSVISCSKKTVEFSVMPNFSIMELSMITKYLLPNDHSCLHILGLELFIFKNVELSTTVYHLP